MMVWVFKGMAIESYPHLPKSLGSLHIDIIEKETEKASSAVKTKGRNTTKGSKAKESSTGSENNKPGKTKRSNEDLTEEQQEKKRLLSRKSSASHKARREALQNGLSVDQAKAAAAKATRLKSRLRYCKMV